MVLGVGLGDSSSEFEQFGSSKMSTRVFLLDEALDIITGLWSGEPFNYHGTHYHIEFGVHTNPHPKAGHPHNGEWDSGPGKDPSGALPASNGVFPGKMGGKITPEDLHELLAFIQEHRSKKSKMDVIIMEATPGDNPEEAARMVVPLAEVGATWWLEPYTAGKAALKRCKSEISFKVRPRFRRD